MNAATSAEAALYQDVVMDHKRAPRNFGTLAAPTHQARGHNPQCGDDLQVALTVEAGRVQDIRFRGQGWASCIAAAAMMTEAVRGRDAAFARELQQRFRAVLTGRLEPEAAQLGKLVSLAGVSRYPSRIKCALLGWHALMHALGEAAESAGDAEPAAVETASS